MAKGATRKQTRAPALSMAALIGRYLLVLGSVFGLFALVTLVGWKLSRMPIEQVEVSGELARVSRDRLQEMVVDSLKGGFLGADLEVIREPLESLPWVYRVVIKRRWPSTLEIIVTEQLPIARWGERGFLNHEGEVFVPDTAFDAGELPSLVGPDRSERQLMNHYKQIQQGLKPANLQVTSLYMDDRGSLRAQLAESGELVFGRGGVQKKLERFLAAYHADLAERADQLQRVDLRYEHGLAVAWSEMETRLASVGE